jgi:hypothetical protein
MRPTERDCEEHVEYVHTPLETATARLEAVEKRIKRILLDPKTPDHVVLEMVTVLRVINFSPEDFWGY